MLSVLIVGLMSVGLTTNSYILVEDMVTVFFCSSLLLLLFAERWVNYPVLSFKKIGFQGHVFVFKVKVANRGSSFINYQHL